VKAMRAAVLLAVGAAVMGLAGSAGCGACEPDRPEDAVASASASAGGPSAPVPPTGSIPGIGSTFAPRPPRLACRAIEVAGDVHMEGWGDGGTFPLLLQGLVPEQGWLALAAGARFTAKDPRTTRETAFRGPGRAHACVQYSEESWVAAGGFDSAVGAGEAPGNEEWVVTPLGVVRYNAAKLSVDVRQKDVTTAVGGGTAFVWPADDTRPRGQDGGAPARGEDGWLRVDGGALVLSPTATPVVAVDAARAAVGRCVALGKDAHDLTTALMAGGADASTVMQQVTTRRVARAACAVAGLRVEALPPSDAATALIKPLAEGNAGWNALPSPPPPP